MNLFENEAEETGFKQTGEINYMSTPLGDRIKMLREKIGISQSELGRRVDLSRASISQYELGAVSEMKMTQLIKMSRALGVDPEELATGVPSAKASLNRSEISFVPVLSLDEIQSSARVNVFQDDKRKFVATNQKLHNGFAIELTDDEMVSSDSIYKIGGFVVFDSDAKPESGDAVLVKTKDLSYPLFRSLRITGNRHLLRPLNPQYPAIEATPEDYEVLGVAKQFTISI